MPVHQQSGNGQSGKPLMPTLSSRFRSTKNPITPKLAGLPQTSPTLSRMSPDRDARPNIASIAKEDASPLSANITPRSGNRRSRIGTDSPATPSGITNAGAKRTRAVSGSKPSREELATSSAGLGIKGAGVQPYTAAKMVHSANGNSASSPNLSRRLSAAKSGIGSEDSSMASPFFHADDAKSSISSYDAPERPKLGPKAATFFYVGNGSITASPDPTRSNSSGSPRPDAGKFFHANDLPEPSPKTQPQRPLLSKKKSTASIGSPQLQSPGQHRKTKSPSRPVSPLKETSYRSAPPALSSPPKSRPTATPVLTARIDATRRTSVGSNVSTPRQTLHKKSSSTNVVSSASPAKPPASPRPKQLPLPELETSPKSSQQQRLSRDMILPDTTSLRSASLASNATLQISTSTIPSPETIPLMSPMLSPSKPPDTSKPAPTPAQEAANNARRERKVLDLEISNSSLLAINRTLEREMRKQSAELRRFRRLSRSGRLSIRTVSGQSKSSLGILAEDEDEDIQALLGGLDEMDLGDSDEEGEGSDDDLNSSSTASESASNLSSTHALKQRKNDEKRLMLDLSKHRQLLIDSEKMNSSIRRCLAWSEEMIKDGQKALDHQVKVGDVQLGGRVLDHDSDDDEARGMGLVSPSRLIGTMEADKLWKDARDEAMSPPESTDFPDLSESPEVYDE